MEKEEYMEVQMLCNAFVNEVVTQITDIREQYLQMERPPYEKELLDTVFKAAETMKKPETFSLLTQFLILFMQPKRFLTLCSGKDSPFTNQPSLSFLIRPASSRMPWAVCLPQLSPDPR